MQRRIGPKLVGIIEAKAQSRLKVEGSNELPRHDRRNALRIVVKVVREPMLALLFGTGTIYPLLGDLKDALILLAFAVMSIAINRSKYPSDYPLAAR